ncbi:MAG: NAD(P)-dependent alcohol dehydrogenase [Myxococcota bacterium]
MKAVIQQKYGSPEVLSVAEIPAPSPGPDDLLVRVQATSISEGDRRIREADFPGWFMSAVGRLMFGLTGPRRQVRGTSFSGRVVAIGARVTGFSVGDAVYGLADDGAAAELVVVKASSAVAPIPPGVDFAEAAALPYGLLTAHTFLRDAGGVAAGDRVLVLGASGGVGRFVVQLAKRAGAHVTGVAGPGRADLLRTLGADVYVDYTREDVHGRGQQYDLVFDTTLDVRFRDVRPLLTPQGRFLTLGMTLDSVGAMLFNPLRGGQRVHTGVSLPTRAVLDEVHALVAEGAVRPVLAARYPLADIVEAHRHHDQRRGGTVVVEVAPRVGVPLTEVRASA